MRHRMTLHNAKTGNTYELKLEYGDIKWQGFFRTLAPDGSPIRGPHGSTIGVDPKELFDRCRGMIEGEDKDVIGVDWDFEEPLPPWLVEPGS